MSFHGEKVRITTDGRTVDAVVLLGSDNRKSLMLSFEAVLDGFVGMMPVLCDEEGRYRNLITNNEVHIEWMR